MQLREREEAERLCKLHRFHARPVPKYSRRGSAPALAVRSPKPPTVADEWFWA